MSQGEGRIEMSQCERDVLKVMGPVLEGKRTQSEAARLLRLSVRQVRRIQRRLESSGDEGVVHGLRGRPSNRRTKKKFRDEVLATYREQFADFGPTLASEKLADQDLEVNRETLRRWLLASGQWQPRRQRDVHRSRRERRACFGELVQMDTSIHEWTEGRGEPMVLVAMIDDASNRVEAGFYEGETVSSHFELLERWLRRYGRPVALYTDHDSIFEWQSKGRATEGQTQFGRALSELQVELILCEQSASEGSGGAVFWVGSGSVGEGDASGGCANAGGGECVGAKEIDSAVQSPLQCRASRGQRCASGVGQRVRPGGDPVSARAAQRGQRLHGALVEPGVSVAAARVAGPAWRPRDHRTPTEWDRADPLRDNLLEVRRNRAETSERQTLRARVVGCFGRG